ncbi:MAG: methylenetetrahydrofolate reductase [Dehalococcoidia bacterium]
MRFRQRLENGRFAVALEILPPQRPLLKVLLRRARLLEGHPQAINVIQRPGRQTSLDASLLLKGEGIEPAWHLVTRGRTRSELSADLERAAAGDISQVLCILGDHAGSDTADSPTIKEAVAMTHDALPSALVGATLNQYGRDQEAVLRNLLPKLTAGASYVQTQPVFDASVIEPFAIGIERAAPDARIIAMAMPLLTMEAGERIEARLGIRLPDSLREVLAVGDQELAWGAFEATIEQLIATPYINGVAIMTFEGDAPAEAGARIVSTLRSAGVLD